eukprot:1432846-Pyramimonas_sp.AAC.1
MGQLVREAGGFHREDIECADKTSGLLDVVNGSACSRSWVPRRGHRVRGQNERSPWGCTWVSFFEKLSGSTERISSARTKRAVSL